MSADPTPQPLRIHADAGDGRELARILALVRRARRAVERQEREGPALDLASPPADLKAASPDEWPR